MKRYLFFVLVAASLMLATSMSAAVCANATNCDFTFDQGNSSAGFGSGNFGNLNLSLSGGVITTTIDLASGFRLIGTGFPGAFGFNQTPTQTSLTYGGFQSGDTVATLAATSAYSGGADSANSLHFDGFGFFDHTAGTTAPSAGSSDAKNVVRFTISKTGGFTTIQELVDLASPAGGDGLAYFVADVFNGNTTGPGAGLTGLIAVTGAVPEPGSYVVLLSAGFGALAFFTERRRKKAGVTE